MTAGIHDLARGQEWLSPTAYSALVTDISAQLATTGARVIFATTTPIPTNGTDARQPSCPEGILDSGVVAYNKARPSVPCSPPRVAPSPLLARRAPRHRRPHFS